MSDAFDLQRFVDAQRPVYAAVLAELRRGQKTSHWMWFIFPQIKGLGGSPTARTYAIASLAEARAYLAHPVLGDRLWECCEILLSLDGRSAEEIFGYPDVLKLRSSMTLFSRAGGGDTVFDQVLTRFYNGEADPATLARL
ncbi:DUF1810 domain-containing protein [Agrobacterium sp. a22-2]|uniref:DUF1810 domain-containing protein n=1 Tax=Agrobacterium sp. a22-2 TaxID=2283840 RepID=UPI0014489C16|nr:DUF1810 domain-containing protein [Agrobacterium sp. a22-2]NKN36546.1 DUF1810 domain-containing protein [Agrobacterium sp. a22-2]